MESIFADLLPRSTRADAFFGLDDINDGLRADGGGDYGTDDGNNAEGRGDHRTRTGHSTKVSRKFVFSASAAGTSAHPTASSARRGEERENRTMGTARRIVRAQRPKLVKLSTTAAASMTEAAAAASTKTTATATKKEKKKEKLEAKKAKAKEQPKAPSTSSAVSKLRSKPRPFALVPPSVHSLRHLPYVSYYLHAPPDLVQALLLEHQLCHELSSKEDDGRELQSRKRDGISLNLEEEEAEREFANLKEGAETAVAVATKLVDKHYRTMSLKLHPDRNGEDCRQAFERLAEARTILRDPDLRRKYVDQMLTVVCNPHLGGATFAVASHRAWVDCNFPRDESSSERHRAATAGGAAPLKLTGGIVNDRPRKLSVAILSAKERRVRVHMTVPSPTYQFYDYCESMHVVGSGGDLVSTKEVRLATVRGDELAFCSSKESGQVTVEVKLPNGGLWELQWYACLHINGEDVKTPRSSETRVDLACEERRRTLEQIEVADEMARRRAGEIRSTLDKLRGPRPDHHEIERRHSMLHSVVARGRSTLNRLLGLLQADGTDESSVSGLEPLREALECALPAKAQLESSLSVHTRRDGLKAFKAHVADLLEAGEAVAWLKSVSERDLVKLGGEPNRLYQLLVEGKGAKYNSLELDAVTLDAAAARTDLFTKRQCEGLAKCREEAEANVAAEAERAMEDVKRQRDVEAKAEAAKEAARAAAAARAAVDLQAEAQLASIRAFSARQSAMESSTGATETNDDEGSNEHSIELTNGDTAQIHGLTTGGGAPFNGTVCTVERRQGDRYIVKCNDGRLRAVPQTNLRKPRANIVDSGETGAAATPRISGSSGASPWACSRCTYLHEGHLAQTNSCTLCECPKEPGSHSVVASPAVATREEQWQQRPQKQTQQQPQRKPHQPPQVQRLPVTSVTKPETPTAGVRGTAEVRKTGNAHLSPKHPGGTGTGNLHTVATKANVAKPLPHKNNGQHPCRDGAHCYWLKKGVCRFYHPPEEIAASGGSVRVECQVRIPPNVVGYVIGRGGQCLHDMMDESGAKIWIDQDSMGPHEMRIVYISGSQKAIDMAAQLVKNAVTEIGGRALMPVNTSSEARPGVAVSPKSVLSVSPKESTSLAPVPPTAGSHLTTPVHQVPVVKPVTTSSVPQKIVQPTPPDHKLTVSVDKKESGTLETISSMPDTVSKHARPHEALQPAPPEPKLASYVGQNENGSGASVSLIPKSAPALQAINQTVAHSCPRETVQPFPPQAQYTPPIDPSLSCPIDSVCPMPNPMDASPLLRQTATYSTPQETVQPVNLEPKLACQNISRGEDQQLLTFMEAHKNCIKGSPEAFCRWLLDSEDIASLSDLAEAVSDDEYLRDVLQPGNGSVGVKGFKRGAFKKAVVEAASCDSSSASSTEMRVEHREAGDGNGSIPTELVCPITHALMTNDPVLAADGFTYERYAIEAWFEKQRSLERGVLSPITNVMMPNLTLIPNHAVRTMARDFSQASP